MAHWFPLNINPLSSPAHFILHLSHSSVFPITTAFIMDKTEKFNNDTTTDVEMGTGNTEVIESGGLKRDLGSRHINMIALAGMIVSCPN